jgi:hypothetical protein
MGKNHSSLVTPFGYDVLARCGLSLLGYEPPPNAGVVSRVSRL